MTLGLLSVVSCLRKVFDSRDRRSSWSPSPNPSDEAFSICEVGRERSLTVKNNPLKWHGGKYYLAQPIVELMPPHLHY
jgi:hypothetical protein